MRRTLALLAVIVVVLLSVRLLSPRQPPSDAAARPPRRPPVAAERPTGAAGVGPGIPERNVFEYVQPTSARAERAALPPLRSPPAEPPAATAEATAPKPVRLVGLVNRGGRLRAALSILGDVVVLAAGEEAQGYRVLSVDEDAGVRLRGPDGSEQVFERPETP
ncbi:MAG TPA: hypothetical protein VMT87_14480 [Vicinamibacteria bacterium]|nr:hypothetical protein [Vicinamibacteria bacterium]